VSGIFIKHNIVEEFSGIKEDFPEVVHDAKLLAISKARDFPKRKK
jgi:hypothetical protein